MWVKYYLQYQTQRVMPFPPARVNLSKDGEMGNFIPAYPNEKGLIELSLPLGEWKVNAKDNGRDPVESVITVKKDATTKKSISMATSLASILA